MEKKKFNYMLEIEILRNSSYFFWGGGGGGGGLYLDHEHMLPVHHACVA